MKIAPYPFVKRPETSIMNFTAKDQAALFKPDNFCKFEYEKPLDIGTTTKNRTTGKKKAMKDNTMKDYANDPFFIKKREAA